MFPRDPDRLDRLRDHGAQAWGWSSGLHTVLLLLAIAALVVGILVLLQQRRATATPIPSSTPTPPTTMPPDPALAELRQRYARGELDRDDYLQRAADLGDRGAEETPAPTPTTGP
jgi:putative membrane protein